jgi:hypothetical protein
MFSRAGLFGLLLCAGFYRRLPKSFKMSPFEWGGELPRLPSSNKPVETIGKTPKGAWTHQSLALSGEVGLW